MSIQRPVPYPKTMLGMYQAGHATANSSKTHFPMHGPKRQRDPIQCKSIRHRKRTNNVNYWTMSPVAEIGTNLNCKL